MKKTIDDHDLEILAEEIYEDVKHRIKVWFKFVDAKVDEEMKDRCSYCETIGRDIVCWECLQEMLFEVYDKLNTLKARLDRLEQDKVCKRGNE